MNIAILIDAENVLPSHADLIFGHAEKLGDIVFKEIYGAASALTSWVAPVLKYAIHPNLTIKAAKGKNSSDIALVIGAMDLLVKGGIDTAIIASSDSDFSSLSVRLRNAGIEVIGMGTDKANALWRTACSSFVVLQNAKPAPAPKPAQPQKAPAPRPAQPQKQPAPAQEPQKQQNAGKKAGKPTAALHRERAAIVRRVIAELLGSHGGRLQTSTLFPALNHVPEYQADRQDCGKKPLNYLTSTFGEAFRFEDTPDGKHWISLRADEAAPAQAQAPAEAEAAKPEDVDTGAKEAPEPQEMPEAPVPEENPPQEAPVPEVSAPEEAAPEAAASDEAGNDGYVTPQQIVDKLVAGGFDPDIARQVTDVFADSDSYRAAYNQLRSVFGNNAGREYYQRAKQLLGANG